MPFPWVQLLGSLAGAAGSKGAPQTTTTTTEPWGPQAEVLKQIFGQAGNLVEGGGQITPGMSPTTAEGLGLTEQTARGFADFLAPYQQAQQFALGDVLSPESNPYLQKYMDVIMNQAIQGLTEGALPAIASGAVSAGGYGGSRQGIAEALATERAIRAGTEGATQLAQGAYGQGLNLLNAALARAPQFAALQFLPGETLARTGATREGYQEAQNLDPYRRLGLVKDLVGGNYGGTTTSTTPGAQGNPILGAVGGAITGGQLNNMFDWGNIFNPSGNTGVYGQDYTIDANGNYHWRK